MATSWLTPKHFEDASRILRGLGMIVARRASDSDLVKRTAAADYQRALQHAADIMKQQAEASTAQAGAAAAEPAESAPSTSPRAAHTAHAESSSTAAHHTEARGASPTDLHGSVAAAAAVRAERSARAAGEADAASRSAAYTQQAQTSTLSAEPAAFRAVSQDATSQQLPSVHDNVMVDGIATVDRRESAAAAQRATEMAAKAAQAAARHASSHEAAAAAQPAIKQATAAAAPAAVHAQAAPSTPPPQQASSSTSEAAADAVQLPAQPKRVLRERRVPESPIGRAMGFAGLGASLIFGTMVDSVSRTWSGPGEQQGSGKNLSSAFVTEQNAERLANALCRMRGAALKIGQMLSIQDENVLPPQVQAALERVRAGADVMPRKQLEGVLVGELGEDWESRVQSFDWQPCAAASIGQVHSAMLPDGRRVAVKVQYPGVARSIESDVDNLMRLITIANVLPKGLYVENAVEVAKRELALECDYTWEAAAQARFKALVESDPALRDRVHVPATVLQLSSRRVMASEWVHGVAIDKVREMPQEVRDEVGTLLLRITLRELFNWRFMQTDPNWGNFLYDAASHKLNLIDFGAAKEFPQGFVDDYLLMVRACAERDALSVVSQSVKLGFLTGDESRVMMDAHTEAGFVVGVPFAARGLYDFGQHGGMTARVSELGAVMLKHRLTPPPEEAYSLHRKLSGAFLACMKLRARVPCRAIFYDAFDTHDWGGLDEPGRSALAAMRKAAGTV